MAEFPALPLFTDAYIADTRHLSTLQHGAYLLLLMTAWRTHDCALPDDDRYLARCAGLDLRTWRNNRAAVLQFWRLDDQEKWCQARLLDERNRVAELSRKKSGGGKASALKRKEVRERVLQQTANRKAAPRPIPSSSEANASSPPTPMLPDWMPVDAWAAFREMRRSIKAPMTAKAIELMIQKLDGLRQRGHDPTAVLNRSIMNNWKDVYEPKEDHHAATLNSPRPRAEQPTWRSAGDDLAARYAREADREEQAAARGDPEPRLRLAEGVRQDEG